MNIAKAASVLVVDDEPSICWGFKKLLAGEGYEVTTASSVEEALQLSNRQTFQLIVLDVRLPGEDGLSALPRLRQVNNDASVIVMTAFGDLETAVAAIQGGASDYLTKPFRLEDAARMCRQALRKQQATQKAAEDTGTHNREEVAPLLVGHSPVMQQVFRQIALVADSELSVLVTGETGTGKELVAAAIARHSRRSDQAYIPVAPVTFRESLVESELFGHVRGAFAGATEDRKGLFELADGGTILLDEISELPMSAQVKLLRVIEHGEFTAVGDVRPRKCDVRVIAATNRDLNRLVSEGAFREDLLYRLSAVSIHLPPLRARREDIPLLCEFFLRNLGYPTSGRILSEALLGELQSRDWYGNIRELRNAIEHASVVARGRPLEVTDLPPPQHRHASSAASAFSLETVIDAWTRERLQESGDSLEDLHERLLAKVEPPLLRVVLEYTRGNRAAAAQLLGIHRGTLRDRVKRYHMLDED